MNDDVTDIYRDIYFAGLFDGEGCVTIDKNRSIKTAVSPVYRLTIQLVLIDRRPLDELKRTYGGCVVNAGMGRLALCPAYRWVICARSAAAFLKRIRPYLRIKPEEVSIALLFQSNVEQNKGFRIKLTDGTVAFREDCRVRLQRLKKRFRVHESSAEPY